MELILLDIPYTPLFQDIGGWVQLIAFIWFIIARYYRWTQYAHLSTAHEIGGKAVLIVLGIGLILMAFINERIVLFRVIVYSTLALWEVFEYFYYKHFPVVYIDDERLIELPKKRIYVPIQQLLDYLLTEPDDESFWKQIHFRNLILWSGFIMLCVYSCTHGITMYTKGVQWGIDKVIREQSKAQRQTNKAISSALSSMTSTVASVVDTLKQGQQDLNKRIETNHKEAVQNAITVKQDLRRTNARLARPPILFFNSPASRGLPQPSFPPPGTDKVKPPEKAPFRKGYKNAGIDSIRTDTTNYAKLFDHDSTND